MPKLIPLPTFLNFGANLVLTMTKALVDQPDQVSVETSHGESTILFKVSVAPGELGQVLGKRGANVELMRKLLQIYSAKSRHRAILELQESSHDEEARTRHPFPRVWKL